MLSYAAKYFSLEKYLGRGEMALVTNDPRKIVEELYSELRSASAAGNLYYARKSLKDRVREYKDDTLQEIAELVLADTDANVEGAEVLFGIIGSARVEREQSLAPALCVVSSKEKKAQFE